MHDRFDTMMDPPVEELLERTSSKFGLVSLAARRARQINAYYGQLGDGLGTIVPPQVPSTASKSLSISFEEIAADKIVGERIEPSEETDEEVEIDLDAEAQAAADALAAAEAALPSADD